MSLPVGEVTPELAALVRDVVRDELDAYFRGMAETMLLDAAVENGHSLSNMPTMKGLVDELMPLIGEGYR